MASIGAFCKLVALRESQTADINELNKTITEALIKATNGLCPKHEKENKIRPYNKAVIEQRKSLNRNNPVPQEISAMNKDISRNIRKDIRQYNKERMQQTIEQNISLKVLRRKLNNGKKEIIKLKIKKGETTSDRNKILAIAEEFYQELYKSQQKTHNTPEKTEKKKGVVNQGSEDISEIAKDEIKNALKNMKD
ncbi:hypothetical protein HUJ04_005206 [Dendroctonus ponderosae]|nr:hypothetical protein HUJ04_005206 [Dendroctonus ponderosae]